MLATAVWGNDALGVKHIASGMLRWHDNVSIDFNGPGWHINPQYALPDLTKLEWVKADSEMHRQGFGNRYQQNSPWGTFDSLLETAFGDARLVCNAIFVAWFITGKIKSHLPLKVASGMLSGKYQDNDEDFIPVGDIGLDEFLARIIRLLAVN